MLPVDEVISIINGLPLKEVLIYLAGQGITGWTDKGYEKLKKIVIDKQNEKKYAFVPNKQEVLFLQEAEKSTDYQQILILVPNYKHIDLIRTGLLLKKYNDQINNGTDSEKNRQNISRIKLEVLKRPGGGRLLKIIKLPSSNFFPIILSYLYELKIHSYPENQLEEEFNELVEEWEICSKFVDNWNIPEEIFSFCREMIGQDKSRFFILALYENQINIVETVIKRLYDEQIIKSNNYIVKIEKDDKGITPRIEVMFFKNPSVL